MRPGHAGASPEVSPAPREPEATRVPRTPAPQRPSRAGPAASRRVPPGPAAPTVSARRPGRSGSDSRVAAGIAQTTRLLRGAALPPTGRGDAPGAPGPTVSRSGLPLEVAAVAARLGHRAAGASQPSGQRPTGGSDGSWIPAAPLRPQHRPITPAPRGAATRRPRGQELGLGSPGAAAPPSSPQPRAPSSFPSHPAWEKPPGRSLLGFPSGSDPSHVQKPILFLQAS